MGMYPKLQVSGQVVSFLTNLLYRIKLEPSVD
jgi:hypothetical protein